MAFSDRIAALLETYSNCLSLLKAFKRDSKSQSAEAEEQRIHLRKSLRSDRSLVERAYSKELSNSGSRFKKGDTPAMSALGQILKNIRTGMSRFLQFSGKKQSLDLDYESLMSLSNASRIEAIKTINRLSRRLDSPARSVVSSSKSSALPSASPSRKKRHTSSGTVSSKKSKDAVSRGQSSSRKTGPIKETQATDKKTPKRLLPPAKPAPKSQNRFGGDEQRASPIANRVSLISMSSGSTQLGEIPERRWRGRYTTIDSSSEEYNIPPLYPLKPYTTEVKEMRFWGMFGRRRGD
ncbi:hypothetical protein B0H63DRAFT_239924 [Podospora didyma]|uniref:Uncharacterized protein n=1 Tax=Podospora didyma TaxID=330526 RepID=A0AAE0NC15_9PEZI|nr:hypothetical protein B0H63DRAFT_239924 [Podospora didyma]